MPNPCQRLPRDSLDCPTPETETRWSAQPGDPRRNASQWCELMDRRITGIEHSNTYAFPCFCALARLCWLKPSLPTCPPPPPIHRVGQYAQEYHAPITLCRQGSVPTCFAVVFGDSQAFMSPRPKYFPALSGMFLYCTDVCVQTCIDWLKLPPHPSPPPRFLGLRFACGGGFVSGFGLGFRTYLPRPP